MALKMILIWAFILGDLFLLIWLIDFIGLRNTGLFMVYYLISIVLSTVILTLIGFLDPKDWKRSYTKNFDKKSKHLKLIGVVILIVSGMLMSKYLPPLFTGSSTGLLVVLYMGAFTPEFLYQLSTIVKILEDAARAKYKWLK